MKVKHISEQNLISTIWSGGTTTQLYIYPETKLFSDRNFDFRISSAVVELEESTFTSLPGYSRVLMILDGELDINHKEHHSKSLKPFEQDSFLGEWETSAKGKVTDFNLIMKNGISGELKQVTVKSYLTIVKPIFNDSDYVAYFVVSGELKLDTRLGSHSVKEGGLLVFEEEGEVEHIQFGGGCELIEVKVKMS